MNIYETQLFEIAPWTQEVMQVAKTLNNGSFMRGRTGWIRRRIENPESIYEHSCKVGLVAYYLFGTDEAIAKGIVHDFGEIYEPDYIPWEVNSDDKREKEFAVMKRLKDLLPNGDFLYNHWVEFENKIGIGVQINELDKMCPSIQAINYVSQYPNNNLEEFQPYAMTRVLTPELGDLLSQFNIGRQTSKDAYQEYFNLLKKINISK